MIMKFTLLDEDHPDFPFGEKRVNITPWLKMGYKKIDDYEIYNPNVAPLKKDYYLAIAVSQCVDDLPTIYPELEDFFNKKGWLDNFLTKDIKVQYLYSMFNENTKAPTDDYFHVFFDDYHVRIHRKLYPDGTSHLYAYDLIKVK